MICYKCGKQIDDDAKFCCYCGAKINVISAKESAEGNIKTNAVENTSTVKRDKKKSSKKLLFGFIGAIVLIMALIIVSLSILSGNQQLSPGSDFVTEHTESTTDTSTEFEDIKIAKKEETQQKTESTRNEDVIIETIHMSTDNMRPTIFETSTIKVRLNEFGYSNNKTVFDTNFIVENDSNEEINVVLTDVIINGYDISASVGKTLVEPGHKSICECSVWQDNIDETGESEWDVMEGVIEISVGHGGDALYSIPVIIDKACWEYEEEYAENNPIAPIVSSDLVEIPEGAIVISSENLYPVLVDENNITATVSSYGYANGKTVFEINFTMENNTTEDLSISLTDVIVDGYDISTSIGNTLVEAGHKAVCDSSIWLDDMEEVGINDWIVLKGTVEISEGYWGDTVYSIPVVIYRNAWNNAE